MLSTTVSEPADNPWGGMDHGGETCQRKTIGLVVLMANSLGLDDDLDGVELVRNLEKAFDIGITDKEAERMVATRRFLRRPTCRFSKPAGQKPPFGKLNDKPACDYPGPRLLTWDILVA